MGKRGREKVEVTCLVKWNQELKARSPDSSSWILSSTQHCLRHTSYASTQKLTPSQFVSCYVPWTPGSRLCQIHSNTSCHWNIYRVPDTEQANSRVLPLIHTRFRGRPEYSPCKRRKLIFRDFKKLAEVTAREEKPEFDAGLLDFNAQVLLLHHWCLFLPYLTFWGYFFLRNQLYFHSLPKSPSTRPQGSYYLLNVHVSGSTTCGNSFCHVYDLFPSPLVWEG